ncbi:MAG TPA: DUF1697 domain-containing protein [Gaiellaceae bacterium]|nr:DUF1697 domain-containing protein [Gaiellaceae bacterium]
MPARSRSTTYAALLRGINLGAHNRIAMADLRALVEGLGAEDVQSYVQSGNVVLRSSETAAVLARRIESAVSRSLGLEVTVVVRTGRRLARIVAANPFAGPEVAPTALHVAFLASRPAPAAVAELARRDFGQDRFEVAGEDVYLLYPGGAGRTKLSNTALERHLGVRATMRNWRTVTALAELAGVG